MRTDHRNEIGLSMYTVDIAHPPLTAQKAEQVLDEALQTIRSHPHGRVLKIIHGKGSNGCPAVLKEIALNWAYRQRSRLRAVIPGTEYDLFHTDALALRKECGKTKDADFGAANAGITVIWMK
ncbi:MAG: hypothetical protein WAV76_05805 [Bacteroidota bacterium]